MQVFHGNIITCDRDNTVARYLVEKEGRIAYVGDELPERFSQIPVIELNNGAVLPVFVDSYIHYSAYSVLRQFYQGQGVESNARLIEQLRRTAASSRDNIVLGFGASEYSVSEGHLISREQLDAVSPDRPVCVFKYDCHSCVVNAAFIELIRARAAGLRGFNEETGELTQEAFEIATEQVIKTFNTRRVIGSMMDTTEQLARRGIGLINSTSGVGFVRDYDFDMEKSVARGLDNGMQMRVSYQTNDLGKLSKKELTRVVYRNLDGSFLNRDALLYEPYEAESQSGISYASDEEVFKFCREANRAGYQIALHAAGDQAFDQAVNALAAALEDFPRYDHRHMIIQAALPTANGLELCARYNIMLCIQPRLATFPTNTPQYLYETLGHDRAMHINPLRTCLDAGVRVCFHSDGPVSEPDPVQWLYDACNNRNGAENISVFEALRMATYYGACSCFDEKERGTLEIGKACDLVIMDASPYEVPIYKLDTLKITDTYLNGKPYEKSRTGAMATMLRGMFPQ